MLAVAFLLGEFGGLMQLPQWLIDISPYVHLSQLPGGTFAATAAVVLTGLAAVAVAAGGVLFRERDIG